MTISILSLHTYPVKSCGGITHTQVGISTAGLEYDRQWVVVDENGNFLTQRRHPRMVLVQPTIDGTALFLNAPEMPTLRVSLHKEQADAPSVPVTLWRSHTLGQDEGDTAARWFSDYLGLACRLYRVHKNAQRLANPQQVIAWRLRRPDLPDFPGDHLFGFADGFPFLIAGQSSLDDLNRRLAAQGHPQVLMSRFRPNIVVQGMEPFEEDYVSSLHVGSIVFALVKHCTRCPMPNVDPLTGEVGAEPMKTLMGYRNFEDGVLFGVNAVVDGVQPRATLSIGDRVSVVLDI